MLRERSGYDQSLLGERSSYDQWERSGYDQSLDQPLLGERSGYDITCLWYHTRPSHESSKVHHVVYDDVKRGMGMWNQLTTKKLKGGANIYEVILKQSWEQLCPSWASCWYTNISSWKDLKISPCLSSGFICVHQTTFTQTPTSYVTAKCHTNRHHQLGPNIPNHKVGNYQQ